MPDLEPIDLPLLVRAHQVGVWRYLRFLGAAPGEADELTQETFVAVWQRPFVAPDAARTKAYLRTVARNLFLKRVRRTRQEPVHVDLADVEADWQRFAGEDDGESWLLALRSCLQDVTPRVREALELHLAAGLTRKETGARLGMSEDGVKSLVQRSRQQLRECIERRLSR